MIFIVSAIVLVKSGSWSVKALAQIARALKWSEFMVAFVLMALATSFPELFVGIMSGINKTPQLSFGNVIGANLINLTLAIGLAVLIAKKLKLESLTSQRTALYTSLAGFLPVLLMIDGTISRIDGLILLSALAFYFQRVFYHKERFSKVFNNQPEPWPGAVLFLKRLAVFGLSVVLLLLSAQGIVWSASHIAADIGLSLVFIGVVIVALGTTLPEVIFTIKAFKMGHQTMILGNLMGSVVINSCLVLGLAVLIHPLKVASFSPYFVGIIFTIITISFFAIFSKTKQEINRTEGFILLAVYLAFIIVQFLLM